MALGKETEADLSKININPLSSVFFSQIVQYT